ncbi:MAG: metallophosphoesterase family protein [Armatimonadota bacterium]
MKFGIISDLHLGHAGDGHWHNRLLYDQADIIARAAVEALNGQELDAVFVLGDISQAGEERQLRLAKEILSGLEASWFVLPGNHDRPAVCSGLFDRVFRGRQVPEFILHNGMVIVGLREQIPEPGKQPAHYQFEPRKATAFLEQLERSLAGTLLLFSHFPFVDGSAWAEEHAGKDAGCFENGEAFLSRAAGMVDGVTAAFSGHQHWHRITAGPAWTHCTTASLIEYPMEVRLVTLEGDRLQIGTLAVAETLAASSLNGAEWVRGRAEDRKAAYVLQTR